MTFARMEPLPDEREARRDYRWACDRAERQHVAKGDVPKPVEYFMPGWRREKKAAAKDPLANAEKVEPETMLALLLARFPSLHGWRGELKRE